MPMRSPFTHEGLSRYWQAGTALFATALLLTGCQESPRNSRSVVFSTPPHSTNNGGHSAFDAWKATRVPTITMERAVEAPPAFIARGVADAPSTRAEAASAAVVEIIREHAQKRASTPPTPAEPARLATTMTATAQPLTAETPRVVVPAVAAQPEALPGVAAPISRPVQPVSALVVQTAPAPRAIAELQPLVGFPAPKRLPKQATAAPPPATGNRPSPGNKPPRARGVAMKPLPPNEIPAALMKAPPTPREDASVLNVGGVAVTLPMDLSQPASPKPAALVKPQTPPMPVIPEVVSAPVMTVPPIETAEPRIKLPPVPGVQPTAAAQLAAAPVAPAVAQAPLPFPTALPPAPGSIEVGGMPLPFESLSQMVQGQIGGCGTAGCASCGDGCAPGRQCSPGNAKCEPFPAKTIIGRSIGLMYENLCCPDPCYQPRWEPITATAFYTDAPRPISQTSLRWDYAHLALFPDRGEYFFARADGQGKGPTPNSPARAIPDVDYHELTLVTEIARGAFSTTFTVPYRSVNPGIFAESAAGFSDMTIATKSLLFDSELFMFAFQMKTTLPAGNFRKGLGNGHVSLEPSAIAGLRFGPKTYGVAQLAEWIPLGGDPDYAGAMLRWNFALNHIWWQPVRNVQLIGTMEVMGYSFQDGAYTDPIFGSDQKLSGQTFVSISPGARLFHCDRFDMGMAYAMGVTGKYYAHSQIRLEFRYRY